MGKLNKDSGAAIAEELESRINEIKKMRDGAEMDLDLEITQRMLENDEKDIKNMNEVVNAVNVSCGMLEEENRILEAELEYYEQLAKASDALDAEEKRISKEIAQEEKRSKELVKNLN